MDERIQMVRDHYDANAEKEWERLAGNPYEFILTTWMMEKYIRPGQRILDIGGGPGRYAIHFARMGCEVVLVDLSEGNIALAKQKAQEAGVSIQAHVCNCLELDRLALGQYDHVFLMGPLYHLQEEEQRAHEGSATAEKLLRDRVTDEEIADVVSRWTGIPVNRLLEGEREKLLRLPDVLHERVIGQDEAVQKVADAILRSRAGIRDEARPIGSFLFLGPTGVGKTELAKAVAEALFDDEKNMVRIDMSEYMEKFSVSRLIGAPPGYVGYEEGGQLTEAVRRKPYSVILFDEVEKAHPDVFNVLLQVLDDGRITDSQGRTVDFKNTIIILTSNLGSQFLLDGIGEDGEISTQTREQVNELLKRSFRPEFLNRLDEIVFYRPLTKDNITHIIDLLVDDLNRRLADKQLAVELTDEAKRYVIDSAYDPIYGARPLRRLIRREVEDPLAEGILTEKFTKGSCLRLAIRENALAIHLQP